MTSPLDGLVTSLRSSTSFLAGNYQIPLSLVHAYGEMYGLTSKLVRTCQTLQYISPHPLVYIALMQLSTPLLVTLAIAYFGQILESPLSSFPALGAISLQLACSTRTSLCTHTLVQLYARSQQLDTTQSLGKCLSVVQIGM